MAYIKYFKSEQVKVFPCSYRGYVVNNNEQVPWDAESRMMTEHNFLHAGSNLDLYGDNPENDSDKEPNTYLISCTISSNIVSEIKCVIGGYYFELSNLDINLTDNTSLGANVTEADCCYLAIDPEQPIAIANSQTTMVQTTMVLKNIETPGSASQDDLHLDVNVAEQGNEPDYRFKGLILTTERYAGVNLKIFNKKTSGNTTYREINESVQVVPTRINKAEGQIVMTHKDQTINSDKIFTENIIVNSNGQTGANANKVDINVDTEITKAIIDNAETTTEKVGTLTITDAIDFHVVETVQGADVTYPVLQADKTNKTVEMTNIKISKINNLTSGTPIQIEGNIRATNANSIENVEGNSNVLPNYNGLTNKLLALDSSGKLAWQDEYDGSYEEITS